MFRLCFLKQFMTFLVLEFTFDASIVLSKLAKLNLFAHFALPLATMIIFLDQEFRPIGKH